MSDAILKFNTYEKTTTAGMWIEKPRPDSQHPDWICGNVMVRCIGDRGRSGDYIFWDWRIFVRLNDEWVMIHPKCRPYGYGQAGTAKAASRLLGNQHGVGPHHPRPKREFR